MQRALRKGIHPRSLAAREAILNAALALFARDGFSGARMDEIAQAAGYNKALLFHYFGDKLGLYRALMERTKTRLFERFEGVLAEGLPDGAPVTAERLTHVLSTVMTVLFDAYIERPEIARIMAWEAAEGWQTFSACAPAMSAPWQHVVAQALEEAKANGIVRPDVDPYFLFTTVMSLPLIHLVSLPRYAAIFPEHDFQSPAAVAQARDQITRILLGGILLPPEGGKK